MTWSRVKETGRGKIALRLVIEGKEIEFVTDSYLAGAGSDGRTRVVGLQAGSISWSESCDIAKATLESDGFTASIVDVDGQATQAFAKLPTKITYLAANLSALGSTATVYDSSVFDVGDYVDIGTETMYVSAIPTSVSLTVSRAVRDTWNQAHYTNDGENLRAPAITAGAVSIEGRRVYVYAYGDGETGNGTLVYRGICKNEASLVDLTTWQIVVDPISCLLEQEVGQDLSDAVGTRGVYYDRDCDLTIRIGMWTTADRSGYEVYTAIFSLVSELATDGFLFYESQDAFMEALNDLIVTKTSGWPANYALTDGSAAGEPYLRAVSNTTTGWSFIYHSGATPKWITVEYSSRIDCGNEHSALAGQVFSGSDPVTSISASSTYSIPAGEGRFPGAGQVPRGIFWGVTPSGSPLRDSYALAERQIPLGGTAAPTADFVTATIQWPECGPYPAEEVQCTVHSVDTVNRFISVNPISDSSPREHVWAPGFLPKITFGRVAVTGNLWDFMQEVLNASADGANVGRVPFLVEDEDVDASTSEATVDSLTASSPILASRVYGQFKPIKLIDILTPELTMMGAVIGTTSSGKIAFRKLRTLAATDTLSGAITAAHQLGPPTWERNALGSINTVVFKTGWDAREDKYNGRTFVVRDVGSLARNKIARKQEIEPKSYLSGDAETSISESDVLATISPLIGLLGYPYDVVTFRLPLTHFDYKIGDTLSIDSAQLPNSNGTRGLSSSAGIVVGRKCTIAEGIVELTLLVTLQNLAGYAPTWRVASYTGTNPYTVTVESVSRPSGYSTIDDMSDGDYLQIANIDSSSPTVRTGVASSVNATPNTFVITLSGAIPAGTLNVDYQSAGAVQVSQQSYGFVSSATGSIAFAPTTSTADTFAP